MKHAVKTTYRFKLYKSRRKMGYLNFLLGIACFIYNHCIALQRRYYRLFGKTVHKYQLIVHITKLKKLAKFNFWKNLNSQAIQDIVERIDRSYKSFFSNRKKNKHSRIPRFCKKEQYTSITLKQSGYKLIDNLLILQKKCNLKFCKSREIEGVIKTITIKRNRLGDYYMFIVTDRDVNQVCLRTGKIAGLDFGLKHFLTRDDGIIIESPLFFKHMYKEIAKWNHKRSHKKGERKGEKKSNGWLRCNYKLQRLYERLRNLRDDFQWKLVHKLCEEFSVICIEDISLKEMQKLWGRKIAELRFAQFVSRLEYVATKFGCIVIKVGRYFASSQMCNSCGYVNEEVKDVRIRKWICPKCGHIHDRDINASLNIKQEGLRLLAEM